MASNLVGTEIPLTFKVANDIQLDMLESMGDDIESVKRDNCKEGGGVKECKLLISSMLVSSLTV